MVAGDSAAASPATRVPFGDLRRNVERLRPEIEAAIARVLDSGWFVLGPELEALETELAGAFAETGPQTGISAERRPGVGPGSDKPAASDGEADADPKPSIPEVVGVGNGTDALAIALKAAGIGPGDEVITSPLTAAFTGLAILQAGATPVFVDVRPDTLLLDPDAARAAVTSRTRALVPVHLYGQMADMPAFRSLADDEDLFLLEDAAQAHGATFAGRPVGAWGDAATLSFYPSKNLGAYGDAGAILGRDSAFTARCRQLRNGGQSARYRHELPGINSRLDELQAAVLRVRLAHLPEDNGRRRAVAARYDEAADAAGLEQVVEDPRSRSANHLYVLRSRQRGALRSALSERGIETGIHYPTALPDQPAFVGRLGALAADLHRTAWPVARSACREVVSLPMFPELTDADVSAVADALIDAGAELRS